MKNCSPASLLLIVLCGLSVVWAQQPSSQPQPPGRKPPEAKTRAEYNDYNTAYAISGGAAVEKAADEFSAKYPNSELRTFLYAKALHEYQAENNSAKMLAMGQKVLSLDPDNTIALVLTATVLSDSLEETDPNRQQKVDEIRKDANHALQTVDTAFSPPANATPEQVAAYKSTLRSMAHSALGITDLKTGDNSGAEQELKIAADLNKTQSDPYIWYHLALAQDHQQKYADALKSVDEALRASASNPDLARLATGERERLVKLTGGATPIPK
jgi:tetratricopeptide (TPR) repeat protein